MTDTGTEADAGAASDGALARRAALGDRRAFSELFRRHGSSAFRYAVHMLDGDEHVAQDVVQEAWIKAWTHLPDFRGEAAFSTWLMRITAREVYSSRRRRRPIPLADDALREHLDRASPPTDTSHLAGGLADALQLELLRLPWRQRAVWLLREMEGLSYADIASVLETTEAVVRGQLHRARRTLALKLEGWR